MPSQEFVILDNESKTFKSRFSTNCLRCCIAISAALVLSALAIVFIVLYVRKTCEKKTMSTTQCSTHQCLSTATYVLDAMDATADPCNDFYQYACGSWAEKFPPNEENYNSVEERLWEDNYKRLELILEDTKRVYESGSAERKLKHFFRACIDGYARKVNSGKILVDRVINPSGGSYLLQENWNSTSWDFQRALSMAQSNFQVPVLFSFVVAPDKNKGMRIIHVSVKGSSYLPNIDPNFLTVINAFKKFVRTVGDQVMRDFNTSLAPDTSKSRLDTFVDDVMTVEKFLANLTEHERPLVPLKKNVYMKSLTNTMNHTIDVTSLLREIFPRPAVIGPDIMVSVTNVETFRMLGDFLSQLHQDKHLHRVMNNYLVWRLMETYLLDLSAPYIDAARQYTANAKLDGEKYIRSYRHCLRTVRSHLTDAIAYMFVRDHFIDANVKQARKLAQFAKKGAMQTISGIRNMEPTMRQALTDTINETTMKIGYTEWINQTTAVDKYYRSLKIGDSHFDNLLSLNLFRRKEQARALASDRPQEPYSWDVIIPLIMTFGSQVLIAPAGLLQLPVYDYRAPKYANQGGLGEQLAEGLFKIFYPVFYGVTSKNAQYAAKESLYQAMKCYGKHLQNVTLGPFRIAEKIKTVKLPAIYLPEEELLRRHWGIRSALKAYIDWETTHGKENTTAGLSSFSNHQLYFLKAAQSYCESQTPERAYAKANSGIPPRKWILNKVLANLPEFGRAYNCKIGSAMNRAAKCDYV